MNREKLVRIRAKTYRALEDIAEEESLLIGELCDRVLSRYAEDYWDSEPDEEEPFEDTQDEDEPTEPTRKTTAKRTRGRAMSLHLHTLRRIAKGATTRQVSERALYFLCLQAEQWIPSVIRDADLLLEDRNLKRNDRKIPPKARIDEEIVREVLLRHKSIYPTPDKSPAGGTNGKRPEATDDGAGFVGTKDSHQEA